MKLRVVKSIQFASSHFLAAAQFLTEVELWNMLDDWEMAHWLRSQGLSVSANNRFTEGDSYIDFVTHMDDSLYTMFLLRFSQRSMPSSAA